jgi:DNA-binding transcriptional LysR family regulator
MVKKALLGQIGDTEIRLLRIFRAVVACGGLAAAELDLNIGRSTISRHLRDLEDRLGLVLCRRGRAGFALTPEGQRVFDDALRLLDAMDSFRADVRDMHAELSGTLSVGLFDKTVTNPQARVAAALRDFRRIAPAVALDLTVGTLTDIESAVIDGRLDVGIVPDHRRSDSLSYTPLFEEAMLLYCGVRHPLFGARHATLSPDELRDYDHAGLAFHSPNMEAMHRLGLRREAIVNDQEAIATLILSGCYIGFLPDHYAASFVREGLIQRIDAPGSTYDVRFVALQRRSPAPTRIGAAFLERLKLAHEARPQPA